MSELKSAKIDLWTESLDSAASSFFSVSMDVLHVLILIRLLTQEEIGIFFFSYAILYLFSQTARGFGVAIRKRATEHNTNRSKYLWNGLIVIIPTLLFLFGLYILSYPLITEYSSINLDFSVVIATLLATTGFSILELSRYYLAGCNKPGFAERFRAIVGKISLIIITFTSVWFYPTVETALISVFITYTITGLLLLYLSPHNFVKPSKDVIMEILVFSKWSLPTAFLNDFYNRWDTILLGFMVGSISLSYYDSSLRIAFLSAVLAVGLSKSSNVKMSGLYETGEKILPTAKKLFIVSTFLVIPLLIITLFNGEFILHILFGEEYKAAKWYLVGLTIIQIFQCYRMQFESIFNSIDEPNKTTKASGLAVIVNIITAPFLVLMFGGLGVIYSTILSEIARILIYEYQIKCKFEEIIFPTGVITQFILFSLLCILIYSISLLFILSNVQLLILSVIFSTVGFYILQYSISSETRIIVNEFVIEYTNS